MSKAQAGLCLFCSHATKSGVLTLRTICPYMNVKVATYAKTFLCY